MISEQQLLLKAEELSKSQVGLESEENTTQEPASQSADTPSDGVKIEGGESTGSLPAGEEAMAGETSVPVTDEPAGEEAMAEEASVPSKDEQGGKSSINQESSESGGQSSRRSKVTFDSELQGIHFKDLKTACCI